MSLLDAPDSTHETKSGGRWGPADAAELYRLEEWGQGYFVAGDSGHLMVRPNTAGEREIDLYDVVQASSTATSPRRWCSASPTSSAIG